MPKSTKFKDYIRKTFIFYTIIIMIITCALFILFMMFNFKTKVINVNQSYNKQLSNFMGNQCDIYKNNVERLVENPIIKNNVNDPAYLVKFNELLYRYSNNQSMRANFVLLDKKGTITASNLYSDNQRRLSNSTQLKQIMNNLEQNKDLIYCDINEIRYDSEQSSRILFAGNIVVGNETQGSLILYLRNEDFKQYIRYKDVDMVVVTDQYDNVVFSTNDLLANSMGKINLHISNKSTVVLDENTYYATTNKIQGETIKIITMTSIKDNQQLLLMGIYLLIGMGILMLILVTVIAPELARRNLKSLDSLNHAILELKSGNVDHRIQTKTFDEFQAIFDEFNQMMSQIQVLIQRNDEMSERKRQMEIKNLEGQFNPHFVFNILEMLRYEVIFDPETASVMIVSFANLMRYNIHYGNVEVPIQTDIEYVEDYLKLQKMRFNKRLSYNIDIDPLLLDYKVPKLIFQPIVENSIKYGIEKIEHLTIDISIKKVEEQIRICVADDGEGIEKERLEMLLNMLKDDNADPSHIGLYNAHRVIQLLYEIGRAHV